MRKYSAEFTVFNHDPSADKPAINGSGEGSTVYRALFAAAAQCVDMGADRASIISGLSMALTGDSKSPRPPALERQGRGRDKIPGGRVRTQNQGRGSKLKGAGAAK